MAREESLEHAALRVEVREWIAANRPPKPDFLEPENFMFVETDPQFEYLRAWQRSLYEAGYLGMDWTKEYDWLSFFLMPMKTEGVDVQPLVKITGEGRFNQVIFDDALAPANSLLGELGQGWEVATMTLTFERGAAEGTGAGHGGTAPARSVEDVAALARRASRQGESAARDPWVRDQLASLWIRETGARFNRRRGMISPLTADRPDAISMMTKAQGSEFVQDLANLAVNILGPDAAFDPSDCVSVDCSH